MLRRLVAYHLHAYLGAIRNQLAHPVPCALGAGLRTGFGVQLWGIDADKPVVGPRGSIKRVAIDVLHDRVGVSPDWNIRVDLDRVVFPGAPQDGRVDFPARYLVIAGGVVPEGIQHLWINPSIPVHRETFLHRARHQIQALVLNDLGTHGHDPLQCQIEEDQTNYAFEPHRLVRNHPRHRSDSHADQRVGISNKLHRPLQDLVAGETREKVHISLVNDLRRIRAGVRLVRRPHAQARGIADFFRRRHTLERLGYAQGKGAQFLVVVGIHVGRSQQPDLLRFVVKAPALGHLELPQLFLDIPYGPAVASGIAHLHVPQVANLGQMSGVGNAQGYVLVVADDAAVLAAEKLQILVCFPLLQDPGHGLGVEDAVLGVRCLPLIDDYEIVFGQRHIATSFYHLRRVGPSNFREAWP